MEEDRWNEGRIINGIRVVHLASWSHFDYITDEMITRRQFIWRGQASAEWPLEPTLDRLLRKRKRFKSKRARDEHLRRFKYAARGRRGANPPSLTDNEWWALGQHFGLATPLLDWSASPYVAAYFAFVAEENDESPRRAVFGISRTSVEQACQQIQENWSSEEAAPLLEIIEPLSDENPRLVSQGGLFTRGPDGVDIETWVNENFGGDSKFPRLLKITIPNEDRDHALRTSTA